MTWITTTTTTAVVGAGKIFENLCAFPSNSWQLHTKFSWISNFPFCNPEKKLVANSNIFLSIFISKPRTMLTILCSRYFHYMSYGFSCARNWVIFVFFNLVKGLRKTSKIMSKRITQMEIHHILWCHNCVDKWKKRRKISPEKFAPKDLSHSK